MARHPHGRPVHSAGRVLHRITVSHVKQREAILARQAASELREEMFEYQVGIAGTANAQVAWQPYRASFPAPMVAAPMQRDSDLDVPQFFFGYHLYNSEGPVVVVAFVSAWDQDESDYTTGASLQIGAFTPGMNADTAFAGYAHLTFQGYSGPVLEDDDSQGTTSG